jgi:hypothetical protein
MSVFPAVCESVLQVVISRLSNIAVPPPPRKFRCWGDEANVGFPSFVTAVPLPNQEHRQYKSLADFGQKHWEAQPLPVAGGPSSPEEYQDIVPQKLIYQFLYMTHPSQVQKTDNEITHHCAFSLPAVALTLGRDNWFMLREAYDLLASDMQVIIYNLHEADMDE